MSESNLGRWRMILLAAVAMLTGCGGPQMRTLTPNAALMQPGLPPSRAAADIPSLEHSGKLTAPLLYATNVGYFDVTVYRARADDPAPLATISDGLNTPFGACIDGQGTLYVTNEPPSAGWVSEYPLGKMTPSKIITDGVNEPTYCAIDAKGNLWVANAYGPNVTEYLKGSKKPHRVITKGLVYPVGIAIDPSGNLYVGNYSLPSQQNVQNVVVYAPESNSPARTITNGVTSPLGLAVDANGTLYVANRFQNDVAEYRSGQDDPFQSITDAMDQPAGVTVDKKGMLYISNIGNHTIVEFAPGSLTPLKRQISKGLSNPFGIAYYPALLP